MLLKNWPCIISSCAIQFFMFFSNYDVYIERHKTYAYSLKNNYNVNTQIINAQIKENYQHSRSPTLTMCSIQMTTLFFPLGRHCLYFCHFLSCLCNVITCVCILYKSYNLGLLGFELVWIASCYVPYHVYVMSVRFYPCYFYPVHVLKSLFYSFLSPFYT